jgi:outer membrane protein TolC
MLMPFPVRYSLFFLVVISLPAWAQQDSTSPANQLSLDAAVSLAVANNRHLKQIVLEVEKAQDKVAATRTERLPHLNLILFESELLTPLNFQFPEGTFGTFPGIGPIPAHNTDISTPLRPTTYLFQTATQPLSQLHRIGLGIQAQEVSVEIAREELRQQRQTVADQVKQDYYSILQTQSALGAANQVVKFYTEFGQLTERYLAQEVVLKSDALNVKTQLAKANYEVVKLQDSLQSQQEALNELLGRDLTTEFTVQVIPELATYELSLAEARRRALDQRPEIREAGLKMKQAQLDVRAERALYIPDVSLSFHYLSPFNVNFVPKNITAVGLMVNWDIFDWGRKKKELAEKTLTVKQADLSQRELEQQILVEVGARFRKLAESRSLIEVDQLARQTEEEKLRVVMNQYRQNVALLKDTLQQEAAVATANEQYREALLSFWTAKADLEKALGEE